jgi:hypothetical protein
MASQNQQQEPATATVRLPDFYADSPQSWFDCIDPMFAAAKIAQPLKKFHWPLAKLPLLADCHRPPAVQEPLRL